MPFSSFHGNAEVVGSMRQAMARERFPHGVILTGAAGSGKYTLALMLAQAMNCLTPPPAEPNQAALPDFCGTCPHCARIAQAANFDARFAEAVEARDALRDTDKKETRILIQTHPDVLVIPPDPPQMMVKVDQVRRVIANIYYRPAEARERVYIFTTSAFMKEAANSLLKVLEEPPEYATVFLLAENAGALLPTIRSRCVTFSLAPLEASAIERNLAQLRPDWTAPERTLVARLSAGAVGRARTFDLAGYRTAREQALDLLASALLGNDHSALFKITETYRAGADGREKTERLLRTLYSLLQDLLWLLEGTPELVRNTDIAKDLRKLAQSANFTWLQEAAQGLAEVERGMRRNLLRSLSLDAFSTALEPA
jgi:DNA polymerase-3 subunit delta'